MKQWESPYLCYSGNPIKISDPNGDDGVGDAQGNVTATIFVTFAADANMTPAQQQIYLTNLRNNIINTWSSYALPNGTPVNMSNVQVLLAPAGMTAAGLGANQNLITVGNGLNADPLRAAIQTSYVFGTNNNQGYFFAANNGSEGAHEFGHMLGLSDRYAEGAYYQPDQRKADHGLSGRFSVPLILSPRQDPTNYNPYNNLMSGAGNGLSNNQLNLIFDGAYNNEETYLAPALIRRSGTGINNANAPALAYTAIGVSKTMMGVAVTPYNGMTPNFNYTKQTISWAFSLKNDKFKTFGELSPEPMNNCLNGPVKRANRNIARLFTHK